MPTVRLTRTDVVEAELPLAQLDVRIGRGRDNDLALKDPDKTLSRHHAELRREGDGWVYLDLNSANGSWVGESRVTRQALTPGLSVALGDYVLTMVDDVRPSEDSSEDLNATRLAPALDITLRPGVAATPIAPARASAAAPPVRASGATPPARASAAARSVVGGAVSVSAAPAPSQPASPPILRRIIIYGSIAVFGAFAIMLAALLMPEAEAPVAKQADPPATAIETTVPTTAVPTTVPTTAVAAATPPATPPPVAPSPASLAPPTPVVAPTPSSPPDRPAGRAAPRPPQPRPVTQPRPARDADPDASAIPARAGETPPALQQRRDDLRRRFALALQRLSSRQFVEARDLLTGVASEAPGFRDLAARLGEADAGLRHDAAEGFKAAAALEASAEWSEALRGYERLRPFAAVLPGLGDATERTRKRMHEAGVDALSRARQYDSRGRAPEAIAWYQRAVNWLPADHPGLEAARQRLAQLVNRP